jgi:hypothetical protein
VRIESIASAAIQLPVYREQLDHGDRGGKRRVSRGCWGESNVSKFIGPMRQLTTTFSRRVTSGGERTPLEPE